MYRSPYDGLEHEHNNQWNHSPNINNINQKRSNIRYTHQPHPVPDEVSKRNQSFHYSELPAEQGHHQNIIKQTKNFYHNLQSYDLFPCHLAIFTDSRHQPYFVINRGWWRGFIIMISFNIIFGMALAGFVWDDQHPTTAKTRNGRQHILKIICIVTLILTNMFYLLTQFLNPGIRPESTITEEEFNKEGRTFCSICHEYKTRKYEHCKQCDVCINNFDHHCAFFGKCIGGYQKLAFFGFLIGMFGSFMVLLASMSWELGI